MKSKLNNGLGNLLIMFGLMAPWPTLGAGSVDVTDGGVGVGNATPLYTLDVGGGGVPVSQMHFSQSGTDVGGWVTSVGDNNFFVSSGAVYNGGWKQKSSDGNAVMAGSGGVGYSVFTSTGGTQGGSVTPALRLRINYAGEFGINTAPVAGQAITTSTGAILTAGGAWQNASSGSYKKDIHDLTTEVALHALAELRPVTYAYKADEEEKHVGFIAEEVPDLVASKDRKSLGALDIVAVLTKAVQEKSRLIDEQQELLKTLAARVGRLEAELDIQQHLGEIAKR
jgi:hypothetical protein